MHRVLTHPFKKKKKSSLLGIQKILYPLGNETALEELEGFFFFLSFSLSFFHSLSLSSLSLSFSLLFCFFKEQ